jgi:hypothetical protein
MPLSPEGGSESEDGSESVYPFPHPLKLTIEAGWVSYCYGHRERAPVARYTAGEVVLPVAVTFALVPAFGPLSVADAAQVAEQSLGILETLI